MPVRGVGPGPGPGRRARATFRRRGQRRQSTTAPKHTGRARAKSLGGRQLLLRRIVSLEDRRQRGAGPRPHPLGTRRALDPPAPAPPGAPNPASSPHFADRKQGLREGKRPAREGTAARPRRQLRRRLCTRPGPAPALPAQRGVRTAAVPTRHPARRTATVSSTRERPFGLLLREIFTREWEEIAPLSCPETNPLKAKAARCMGGEALES